jgi:hypothetical protein
VAKADQKDSNVSSTLAELKGFAHALEKALS